jgi:hypothetical protein
LTRRINGWYVVHSSLVLVIWIKERVTRGVSFDGPRFFLFNTMQLLFTFWEVLVHDGEALLVDLEVLVVLKVVDGDHPSRLLDELGVLVDRTGAGGLLVNLADLEDVLKTVQRDLDDLVVHRLQEVAHGLDAPLADEIADLVRLLKTTRGGVGDGPARLLLSLEVGILEDVDERRNNVAEKRQQVAKRPTRGTDASMTAWICMGEPAVMLEMVQHASLRIPSLGEESRLRRAGRAPDEMTTWVWRSSPVTMLPTDRSAGV